MAHKLQHYIGRQARCPYPNRRMEHNQSFRLRKGKAPPYRFTARDRPLRCGTLLTIPHPTPYQAPPRPRGFFVPAHARPPLCFLHPTLLQIRSPCFSHSTGPRPSCATRTARGVWRWKSSAAPCTRPKNRAFPQGPKKPHPTKSPAFTTKGGKTRPCTLFLQVPKSPTFCPRETCGH